MARVPKEAQGRAKSLDELVALGLRYEMDERTARAWAQCVLRSREWRAKAIELARFSPERRRELLKQMRKSHG